MFLSEEYFYCFRLFRLGVGMDKESTNENLKQRISELEIVANTRNEKENLHTIRIRKKQIRNRSRNAYRKAGNRTTQRKNRDRISTRKRCNFQRNTTGNNSNRKTNKQINPPKTRTPGS